MFSEKPKEFLTNKINAGVYLFNKGIIDKIPMKNSSLERDIFPKLASEGILYCM